MIDIPAAILFTLGIIIDACIDILRSALSALFAGTEWIEAWGLGVGS